jgi:hypothetical protein
MLEPVYNPTDAGRTLFVDAANGSDATARPYSRDRVYKTLGAAKAAAVSGDLIWVRPGTYDERDLLKDGVNWHFEAGATVEYTGTGDGGIFDDDGGAATCVVTGAGRFLWKGTSTFEHVGDGGNPPHSAVRINNADSNVSIEGELLYATSTGLNLDRANACFQAAGKLVVKFREILGGDMVGVGYNSAVWWAGGELHVRAERIQAWYYSLLMRADFGAPAANAYVSVDLIQASPSSLFSGYGGILIYGDGGPNPNVVTWIDAKEIRCHSQVNAGKTYIRAEKITTTHPASPGPLTVSPSQAPQVWASIQKITVASIQCDLDAGASGHAEVEVLHVEDTTGGGTLFGIGQNARLRCNRMALASATSRGLALNADCAGSEFSGVIDGTAASAGNAVVAGGSTGLTLRDAVLLAHSTREAIAAATAATVTIRGALAINRPVGANVTLSANAPATLPGTVTIPTGAAGNVGLVVKGAAGQTANLQQWQDSAWTVVARLLPTGQLSIAIPGQADGTLAPDPSGRGLRAAGGSHGEFFCPGQMRADGGFNASTTDPGTSLLNGFIGKATQLQGIAFPGDGTNGAYLRFIGEATAAVTMAEMYPKGPSVGTWLYSVEAAAIPLRVKGAASQSGNLTEWQDSAGAVLGTVSENGYFTTRKNAAPADAELAAGELAWWFDSTNGAAKLMLKGKTANGTVVTGQVALA